MDFREVESIGQYSFNVDVVRRIVETRGIDFVLETEQKRVSLILEDIVKGSLGEGIRE